MLDFDIVNTTIFCGIHVFKSCKFIHCNKTITNTTLQPE